MAGVGEEYRRRIAMYLFLVGLGLILGGVVLVVLHRRDILLHGSPPALAQAASSAQVIRGVLFLSLVLVGIFAVSSLAYLRWSRRFRRLLFHKPAPPTPADDVWRMHRLPDEQEPEGPPERNLET